MYSGALRNSIESAVPICIPTLDRKSTRLNSSHLVISYAVFCLKKKNTPQTCLGSTPQRWLSLFPIGSSSCWLTLGPTSFASCVIVWTGAYLHTLFGCSLCLIRC